MLKWIASFFVALLVSSAGFAADTAKPTATLAACPQPDDVQVEHLYGLWRAEFRDASSDALLSTATLLFEKHAEFPQSVSGAINRDGSKALVSGDVEAGAFSLDESVDGVAISATWSGSVLPGACGKEIRGTWTDVRTQTTQVFVLRKLPGWQ